MSNLSFTEFLLLNNQQLSRLYNTGDYMERRDINEYKLLCQLYKQNRIHDIPANFFHTLAYTNEMEQAQLLKILETCNANWRPKTPLLQRLAIYWQKEQSPRNYNSKYQLNNILRTSDRRIRSTLEKKHGKKYKYNWYTLKLDYANFLWQMGRINQFTYDLLRSHKRMILTFVQNSNRIQSQLPGRYDCADRLVLVCMLLQYHHLINPHFTYYLNHKQDSVYTRTNLNHILKLNWQYKYYTEDLVNVDRYLKNPPTYYQKIQHGQVDTSNIAELHFYLALRGLNFQYLDSDITTIQLYTMVYIMPKLDEKNTIVRRTIGEVQYCNDIESAFNQCKQGVYSLPRENNKHIPNYVYSDIAEYGTILDYNGWNMLMQSNHIFLRKLLIALQIDPDIAYLYSFRDIYFIYNLHIQPQIVDYDQKYIIADTIANLYNNNNWRIEQTLSESNTPDNLIMSYYKSYIEQYINRSLKMPHIDSNNRGHIYGYLMVCNGLSEIQKDLLYLLHDDIEYPQLNNIIKKHNMVLPTHINSNRTEFDGKSAIINYLRDIWPYYIFIQQNGQGGLVVTLDDVRLGKHINVHPSVGRDHLLYYHHQNKQNGRYIFPMYESSHKLAIGNATNYTILPHNLLTSYSPDVYELRLGSADETIEHMLALINQIM